MCPLTINPYNNTKYRQHSNDPINVLEHRLSNGLTLIMSINPVQPRIFTNIVVRSGSKQDPPETTGLAHYMEHMLFKGTSKIGALNWEKESILLQQISDLYEAHRHTSSDQEKREIYKKIDQLSQEAAKYVAANEYDKLASSIGATGTNAYTWVDQTVYVNDIPTNELERWFQLESERFRMMALRLFHTELETVYEEFNISQDRDVRKTNNAIRSTLFSKHPYGTQTTIGSANDLKNPSQEKIQWYFNTYYVPNNMAIVASGDFDPDQFVAFAEQYFGEFLHKPLPPFQFEQETPLSAPIQKTVLGQTAAYVDIAWRLEGAQSKHPFFLTFISNLLRNGKVGLMDINLNQNQKLLASDSWYWIYRDYSVLGLYGKPREHQSLEEVVDLLLEQVNLLREGVFDEEVMEALINHFRLSQINSFESNKGRVQSLTDAFILGWDWSDYINRLDWYKNLTKQDIQDFVNTHLQDNYVLIRKEKGDDPKVIKVEKPPITPVKLNRQETSSFGQQFLNLTTSKIEPVFVDYNQKIKKGVLSKGVTLDYTQNPYNELFQLCFIFDKGRFHHLELALAEIYLGYVGSRTLDKATITKAFFKLGINFEFSCKNEETFIFLKGLNENLEEGLAMLEHLVSAPAVDQGALDKIVEDILTRRRNQKSDKQVILRDAMYNYGKYGIDNPFNHRLPKDKLLQLRAETLVDQISTIRSYEHSIYYYGPSPIEEVSQLLENYHLPLVGDRLPSNTPSKFKEVETKENKIFFVDFPTVQTELYLISRGTPYFNFPEYLMSNWFNDYFGYGLSSIVFQEIRESKGLAYSASAFYTLPYKKEESHYLNGFIGTQPDKLKTALTTFLGLVGDMPISEQAMDNSRKSILKQLESHRVHPNNIFWEHKSLMKRGFAHDIRKDAYRRLQLASSTDLINFYKNFVQDRSFSIMLLGEKSRIDFDQLSNIAPIREIELGALFGY